MMLCDMDGYLLMVAVNHKLNLLGQQESRLVVSVLLEYALLLLVMKQDWIRIEYGLVTIGLLGYALRLIVVLTNGVVIIKLEMEIDVHALWHLMHINRVGIIKRYMCCYCGIKINGIGAGTIRIVGRGASIEGRLD